jgi:hypothetical protein
VLDNLEKKGRVFVPISALRAFQGITDKFTVLATPFMIPACFGKAVTNRMKNPVFVLRKELLIEVVHRTYEFAV